MIQASSNRFKRMRRERILRPYRRQICRNRLSGYEWKTRWLSIS